MPRSSNSELFALPSMAPVRQAIDGEFERYIIRHKAELPNETIGVGEGLRFPAVRSRAALFTQTRVRAGGHRQPDGPRLCLARRDCGEIRLIYRLTRTEHPGRRRRRRVAAVADDAERRAEGKGDHNRSQAARRSHAPKSPVAGCTAGALARPAQSLREADEDGPLDLIGHENIDRIETNLQIAHAPKSAVRDFRTDYLLKVFRYDRAGARVRGSADGKPDRSRADSGGRKPQARVQGMAARSRASRRIRSRHDADPGKISRQRRDCADAGRISIHRTCSRHSAWCRARAR